jgi:hypothetical protein
MTLIAQDSNQFRGNGNPNLITELETIDGSQPRKYLDVDTDTEYLYYGTLTLGSRWVVFSAGGDESFTAVYNAVDDLGWDNTGVAFTPVVPPNGYDIFMPDGTYTLTPGAGLIFTGRRVYGRHKDNVTIVGDRGVTMNNGILERITIDNSASSSTSADGIQFIGNGVVRNVDLIGGTGSGTRAFNIGTSAKHILIEDCEVISGYHRHLNVQGPITNASLNVIRCTFEGASFAAIFSNSTFDGPINLIDSNFNGGAFANLNAGIQEVGIIRTNFPDGGTFFLPTGTMIMRDSRVNRTMTIPAGANVGRAHIIEGCHLGGSLNESTTAINLIFKNNTLDVGWAVSNDTSGTKVNVDNIQLV